MYEPGMRVLAAVSGGPDSIAMLHILHGMQAELGISLLAAHLDHGFRGDESAADARYVAGVCASLDVPCTAAFEDVPAYRDAHRLSSQEAARLVRHAFLRRVAAENGADRIALGHTRDDRVESILLNLFRGAGPEGLIGFPPVSAPIVRPLWECSRAETESYCEAHSLQPRIDSSNARLDYSRNRIRLQLLPEITAHYNPRTAETILRMSDLVASENDLLNEMAAQALSDALVMSDDRCIVLDRAALQGCHVALQRRVVRLAIERVRGHLRSIDAETVQCAVDAIAGGAPWFTNLPVQDAPPCSLRVDINRLKVARGNPDVAQSAWSIVLPHEGDVSLPCGGAVRVVRCADFPAAQRIAREILGQEADRGALLLAEELIRGPLVARSRRPGDRMRPRGMQGARKLQDLFVDKKVPLERRPCFPVITDEGGPAGCDRPTDSDLPKQERILGVLGLQGGEQTLSIARETTAAQNFPAYILVLALSS